MLNIPVEIVIHHSGSKQASWKGPESVKAIQEYHMFGRSREGKEPFSDIGYHFVVGPTGHIYEGRPPEAMGASVRGENSGKVAICAIGDFRIELVPILQLDFTEKLVAWLIGEYQTIKALTGHRDHNDPATGKAYTECPGDHLYELMTRFKEIVQNPGG